MQQWKSHGNKNNTLQENYVNSRLYKTKSYTTIKTLQKMEHIVSKIRISYE